LAVERDVAAQDLKVCSAMPLGSSKNTVIAEFMFHRQ
jgi:hypothetical protein